MGISQLEATWFSPSERSKGNIVLCNEMIDQLEHAPSLRMRICSYTVYGTHLLLQKVASIDSFCIVWTISILRNYNSNNSLDLFLILIEKVMHAALSADGKKLVTCGLFLGGRVSILDIVSTQDINKERMISNIQ